jgi:hypothetical protein
MLGGITPLANVLGAAPPADSETLRLKNFTKAAVGIGLHLLLIEPYGKAPVDMRSPAQRRTEDTAAQQIAREAGRPDWSRVKSRAGVHLATDNATLLTRYIDKYRKTYESDHDNSAPVNMAVAVGPSRLIVVDCDTEEQVVAFLNDAGIPQETPLPPTVRSPGQRDAEGNWVHYGGGHYYFTLPDGLELPDSSGSLTMPGGYAILWAGRYVLIPPSVRAEGVYQLAGQDYPAPSWIIDRIMAHVAGRRDRRTEFGAELGELGANIDAWAAAVSWDDLLEPAGWSLTARPDGCGCQVWTAPGAHASPKSATAHDTGCTYGRYSEVNAPLHIWTDNPGPEFEAWCRDHGSSTMSKLQVAAVLYYNGDVGTACAELGMIPKDDLSLDTDDVVRNLGLSSSNLNEPMSSDVPNDNAGITSMSAAVGNTIEFAGGATVTLSENTSDWSVAEQTPSPEPFTPTDTPSDPPDNEPPSFSDVGGEAEDGVLEAGDQFMPRIALFDYWRDYPAPEFVVDGLIENGGLAAIIGQPNIGKSAVVLDILNCIATGQRWRGRATKAQRVLYLPGEGMSGSIERTAAWEKAHKANVGHELAIGEGIIKAGAPKAAWERLVQVILQNRIGLVAFDTFARMAVGIEENSATDVGKVIARLDEVRKLTGCTVLIVHHTAKSSDAARGSSALNGALDTEILITDQIWSDDPDNPPPGKQMTASVTKQKNAALIEDGIPLLMVPFESSIIITGPSGEIGDVLDEAVVARAILPEPAMETAARLAGELAKYTEQGLTLTEAAIAIRPDEWTARRADASRAWRLALRGAVDLGLRFSLFETLTGTASGARYVLSTATVSQFKSAVIAAGLSD